MTVLQLTIGEMLEILEAPLLGTKKVSTALLRRRVKICTDSRELAPGVVFWPLIGKRVDAHEFLPQAAGEGALMSIVQEDRIATSPMELYVPVKDTTEALLKLAAGYAKRFDIRKIAITGSNGKTTTKDMLDAVLSRRMRCLTTKGNFNNHIGVPLTLFRLTHQHECAIVEIGISGPGEIRPLSLAVRPQLAMITNIGPSHLERLGTLDNVFKEKASIAAGLQKGGVLVVNSDDPFLCKLRSTTRYRVLTYGIRRGQVRPENLQWDEEACASFRIGRTQFRLPVPGIHNLYNALGVIAVAAQMRIPKSEIAAALAGFRASNMRMEIRNAQGFRVVADCYNANPGSTRAALETVGNVRVRGKRIAVLGDMLELGENSREMHVAIGRKVPEMDFQYLVAVGKEAAEICAGARAAGMPPQRVCHFNERSKALEYLSTIVNEGDLLLVKGSRGMRLEEIVDGLMRLQFTGDRAC